MRVPQAREALQEIRERSPGTDVWQREVTRILDAVWLQAYEEGRTGLFGSPAKEEENRLTAEEERAIARHDSLKRGGKMHYCCRCGEYIILVRGKWEADGLNYPEYGDLDARLACDRGGSHLYEEKT